MNRYPFALLPIATCLFVAIGAEPSDAATPIANAVEIKSALSQADAEKIALSKVPGGIIETAKLETENKKNIWSVDVKMPKSKNITEVHIDVLTGKVMSLQIETPAQQAKEAAADRRQKK